MNIIYLPGIMRIEHPSGVVVDMTTKELIRIIAIEEKKKVRNQRDLDSLKSDLLKISK